MTLNLKPEEIDILLEECDSEINKVKSELTGLFIKRDSLKRKKAEWEEQKQWLETLKSGLSFDEFLTTIPQNTLTTLQKHYHKVMKRYENADWNSMKQTK